MFTCINITLGLFKPLLHQNATPPIPIVLECFYFPDSPEPSYFLSFIQYILSAL